MDSVPTHTIHSSGRPINENNKELSQEHPMLGTPIGNSPMSPF